MARFERLRLKEVISSDGSKCWLVQYAVDGVPCVPFYDHDINRRAHGTDESWFRDLERQAELAVRQYGRAEVMT